MQPTKKWLLTALTTQCNSANTTNVRMLVWHNSRACQDTKDRSGAVHWARCSKTKLRSVLVVRDAKCRDCPSHSTVAVHWHCTGSFCLSIHGLFTITLILKSSTWFNSATLRLGKVQVEYNHHHARPSDTRPPHTYLQIRDCQVHGRPQELPGRQ